MKNAVPFAVTWPVGTTLWTKNLMITSLKPFVVRFWNSKCVFCSRAPVDVQYLFRGLKLVRHAVRCMLPRVQDARQEPFV